MARVVLKYSLPVYRNTPVLSGSNVGRLLGFRHVLQVWGLFLMQEEIQPFIDDAIDEPDVFALKDPPAVSEVSPETGVYSVKVVGEGHGSEPIASEFSGTGTWAQPR